jgi:dihydroxyacetone kinase-like predicted kinase
MSRFLPTASADENAREMSAELAEAATGEITIASRDATLDGVNIEEGSYLGLVDGTAVVSGRDLDLVMNEVVDRVVADGKSVLTILTGEGAPALDGLLPALEMRHSDLEFIDVHEGGQPHYPILVVAQ